MTFGGAAGSASSIELSQPSAAPAYQGPAAAAPSHEIDTAGGEYGVTDGPGAASAPTDPGTPRSRPARSRISATVSG